ncbi:DUF2809 domain-containing protein [Streptococcus ovuberis]|uniref:DUF2809 domain-containing protein n=1 Tax=Streptococcus ovuberis TaxID=1936207 RepID=A0A7X6MXX5_9STRE|nr:DUF2809 domain-containing protein [Streptococcus ovuberis]NKZ19808.1 DUF2809 domain-containing protein [Streptococcus ovuberis]
MKVNWKNRSNYSLLLVIVIGLGLGSRKLSFLPLEIGDGLWAVAVYLGYSLLCPQCHRYSKFFLALLTSFLVEFSQLLQWNWLVVIRQSFWGHLLLGQGFLWQDLLAYIVGLLIMLALDGLMVKWNSVE